jgi:hypothetical protein
MWFAGVLLLPSLLRLIWPFMRQGNPDGYSPVSLTLPDRLDHHGFSGLRSFSRRAPHNRAVLLLAIMETGFVGLPARLAVKFLKNPFV